MPSQFYSKIVGVTFDNRQQYVRRLVAGQELRLVRDSANPYDHNAIAVYDGPHQLGFLRKEVAESLAPEMDRGVRVRASVEEVTGQDYGNYGANIKVVVQEGGSSGGSSASELVSQGKRYLNGDGVEESDEKATECFRQAAEMGDPEGMVCLGEMFEYGYGCDIDWVKAHKWFKASAETGCGHGEFRLGWLYDNADSYPDLQAAGFHRDPRKVRELYHRAFEHGYRDRGGTLLYWRNQGLI